jgi:hypothetical protein
VFNPDDLIDKIGYAAGEAEVYALLARQGYFGTAGQEAIEALAKVDPDTDVNVTDDAEAGG